MTEKKYFKYLITVVIAFMRFRYEIRKIRTMADITNIHSQWEILFQAIPVSGTVYI